MTRRVAQRARLAGLPDIGGSIVKRTVGEQISDKLASHIASGSLQIGDLLPGERELAAAFSVSREFVRSAIQDLASRGLIEVSQGARTRVVSAVGAGRNPDIASPLAINRYDLASVHGARLLAERAVVAEAAERIDGDTLARLETSMAAQKHCLDDPVRFLICDREFHTAIYRCSSNPLLSDFVIGLYTYLMEHRRTAMSQPVRHSAQLQRSFPTWPVSTPATPPLWSPPSSTTSTASITLRAPSSTRWGATLPQPLPRSSE